MGDIDKTKEQLMNEGVELRQRIIDSETPQVQRKQSRKNRACDN